MRLNNGLDLTKVIFPREVTFVRVKDINLDDAEYDDEVTHLIENVQDWNYTCYYLGIRGYVVKNDEEQNPLK